MLAIGKDNNFNLLRLIAALTVLFSHSFAMLGFVEPFTDSVGKNLGAMAVDVFFVTSGFLVAASLIRRQDVIAYVCARAQRIFPALWLMLFLTVFVLGPVLTQLTVHDYFRHQQTWHYFINNAMLMGGLEYYLPAMLESNSLRGVVNGSLWTMVYEVSMYGLLLLSWIVYFFASKFGKPWLAFVLAVIVLLMSLLWLDRLNVFIHVQLLRFTWFFFVGSCFYLLRQHIRLSGLIMLLIIVGAVIGISVSAHTFLIWYYLVLPYTLFYLAYIPSGFVRQFNRVGDYSYGVYLYAFPIQQALVYCYPTWNVGSLSLIASLLTLLCAIGSWHLVEKPCLRWRLVEFLQKLWNPVFVKNFYRKNF